MPVSKVVEPLAACFLLVRGEIKKKKHRHACLTVFSFFFFSAHMFTYNSMGSFDMEEQRTRCRSNPLFLFFFFSLAPVLFSIFAVLLLHLVVVLTAVLI